MNERILELAKQSLPAFYLTNCPSALEKFAESIVRECVDVVKWTPSMFPNDTIIKNIKEHFGVN